jgi:hypothetical protein
MGRPVFYMNRRAKSFLRRQLASATKNSTLTREEVGGKKVEVFDGIPVRTTDALTNTEAAVA